MHSVTDRRTDRRTDRQTDGQQAYANSRSYCVAVRSAKNQLMHSQKVHMAPESSITDHGGKDCRKK